MSKKFAVGNCETRGPVHQGGGFATFNTEEPIDIHYFPQMNSLGFAFSAQFEDGAIRMYREDGLCPDAPAYSLKLKPQTRGWKDSSEIPEDAFYFKDDVGGIYALSSFDVSGRPGKLYVGQTREIQYKDIHKWSWSPSFKGPWTPCTITE